MTILEKNKEALKKKNQKLYQVFLEWEQKASDLSEVCVEKARDGSQIISFAQDGKQIFLNSTYCPSEEARRYAKKYDDLVSKAILVTFGLGNGKIAKELMHIKQQDILLFFYEPSPDIFLCAMKEFDLSEIFEEERTEIFVNELNGGELSLYLDANMSHSNYFLTFIEALPKYRLLFPEEYVHMYHMYEDRKKLLMMDINTRVKVKKEFMENSIRNLEFVFHGKSASDLKSVFTSDMTAVLVSAGPSLEKNVDLLKEAKGKVFILAVDTAARFLLDRGIEPDMVAAIDYLKPLRLFEDEKLKKIPLVMLTNFNYKVMELLDGTDYIYGSTDTKLYMDFFKAFDNEIVGLPQGGSVATYAFALLQYWGFHKIILIGQDLAMTGNQHHAGEEKIKKEDIKREIIELPGNVEEKVYTTSDYYAYLRWFEMAVEHFYPNGEVINATEGGAKIEGMRIMTFKEALAACCDKEYNFQKLIADVRYIIAEDKRQDAYEYLVKQLTRLKKLKKTVKKGKDSAGRALTLVERGDIFSKEFKKLNKTLDNTCKIFEDEPVSEFLSKLTADTEIASVLDLYISDDDESKEMERLYKKLEINYDKYYEHSDEVIELFDKVLNQIREKYHLEAVE